MSDDHLLLTDASDLLLTDGSGSFLLLAQGLSDTGVPGVAVEIGFGSTWQTEPASITWTDVTQYVLHRLLLRTYRGSSDARGKVDVGRMDLSLVNNDRRFDPLYAAGPHFGDLKPGVPIRVTLTPEGESAVQVFEGTVAKWPQRYDPGNRFAWVPVQAWDGFDKFSRAKTPRSIIELTVMADTPAAYWRLDESDGAQMVDSSGNGNHGILDNLTLGEPPLVVDGAGHSAFFEHVGDNRGQFKGATLPTAAPVTIEAWVKLERNLSETHMIVVAQRDNAFGSGLILSVEASASGSPNGELVVEFFGLGGFYKARGHKRVDDNRVHHVVMTMASTAAADIKLYVDGVVQTKTVISGTTGGTWNGHYIWSIGNAAASAAFDFGVGGWVDEVAVYDYVLTPTQVLNHYEAGFDALDQQTTDERIDYLLDNLGWPTNRRDLETGDSMLGPARFDEGDKLLDYFRRVQTSEDGYFYMTTENKVRFVNRFWRYLNTLATTSQITFSDATPDTSGYADFDLDLDDELLVNVARLTRQDGVEQTAVNQTSIDTYGEAEMQQSNLLHQTDAEVRALAEWTVITQGDPLPRVPSVSVPLHKYASDVQAAVLALDIGHRITCERTPQNVGAEISLDLHIEGIRLTIGNNELWWTAYVSPVRDEVISLFILDTSQLDGLDVLAY